MGPDPLCAPHKPVKVFSHTGNPHEQKPYFHNYWTTDTYKKNILITSELAGSHKKRYLVDRSIANSSTLYIKCFPSRLFKRKHTFALAMHNGGEDQRSFNSLLWLSCQQAIPNFFFHTSNISIIKMKQHECRRKNEAVSLSITCCLPFTRSKFSFCHTASKHPHANHRPLRTGDRIHSKV